MKYLLGIDAGTTNTKVVLMEPSGEVVLSYDQPNCPIQSERPLWSEQPTEQFVDGNMSAIRGMVALMHSKGISVSQIGAIGFTGQMHSSCLLEEGYKVRRPKSILWCDQRACTQVDAMIQRFTPEGIVRLTANRPTTGYSGLHFAWIKDNEPEIFEATHHFTLLMGYLAYRMTGIDAINWNDAAGTSMFDVASNCWSPQILGWLGISQDKLPKVVAPGGLIGYTTGIEAITDLPDGIPVFGGLGDCDAGALGSGITSEGDAALNLATGCTLVVPSDQLLLDIQGQGRVQFYPSLPNSAGGVANYHILTTMLSAGAAIDEVIRMWIDDQLDEKSRKDYLKQLDQMASELPFDTNYPIIDTRWRGDRTPTWKSDSTARVYKLTSDCNRPGHWMMATMKGIAGQMTGHMQVIQEIGVPVNNVILMGGGSKSDIYRGIMAATLASQFPQMKFQQLTSGQGSGARGAALAAGVGLGEIQLADLPDIARATLEYSAIEPNAEWVEVMKTQYAEWLGYFNMQ